ncbi:MAG: helix-turn-helix domain-containing protein [Rhodocyclaceae bacterium]|nr:helix-turn-helix domain-containing protein [Rhodocyclaceae bacterium]
MPVTETLDRLAESLGVAPDGVADALGIPPGTIKTWKHRGAIPAARLMDFAEAAGVPVEQLTATGMPSASEEENTLEALLAALRVLPAPVALALLRHAMGLSDERTFAESVLAGLGLRADFADRMAHFR